MRRWTGGAAVRGEFQAQHRPAAYAAQHRTVLASADTGTSKKEVDGTDANTATMAIKEAQPQGKSPGNNPWGAKDYDPLIRSGSDSKLQSSGVLIRQRPTRSRVGSRAALADCNKARVKKARRECRNTPRKHQTDTGAAPIKRFKNFDHRPIPQLSNGHLSSRTKTGTFVIRPAKESQGIDSTLSAAGLINKSQWGVTAGRHEAALPTTIPQKSPLRAKIKMSVPVSLNNDGENVAPEPFFPDVASGRHSDFEIQFGGSPFHFQDTDNLERVSPPRERQTAYMKSMREMQISHMFQQPRSYSDQPYSVTDGFSSRSSTNLTNQMGGWRPFRPFEVPEPFYDFPSRNYPLPLVSNESILLGAVSEQENSGTNSTTIAPQIGPYSHSSQHLPMMPLLPNVYQHANHNGHPQNFDVVPSLNHNLQAAASPFQFKSTGASRKALAERSPNAPMSIRAGKGSRLPKNQLSVSARPFIPPHPQLQHPNIAMALQQQQQLLQMRFQQQLQLQYNQAMGQQLLQGGNYPDAYHPNHSNNSTRQWNQQY